MNLTTFTNICQSCGVTAAALYVAAEQSAAEQGRDTFPADDLAVTLGVNARTVYRAVHDLRDKAGIAVKRTKAGFQFSFAETPGTVSKLDNLSTFKPDKLSSFKSSTPDKLSTLETAKLDKLSTLASSKPDKLSTLELVTNASPVILTANSAKPDKLSSLYLGAAAEEDALPGFDALSDADIDPLASELSEDDEIEAAIAETFGCEHCGDSAFEEIDGDFDRFSPKPPLLRESTKPLTLVRGCKPDLNSNPPYSPPQGPGNAARIVQSVLTRADEIDAESPQIAAEPETPRRVRSAAVKPKDAGRLQEAFARFWKAYPRKVAKPAALKAFLAINPGDALVETMIAAVRRSNDSPDWSRDEGKYIPHPRTWLSQRRWEDEIGIDTSVITLQAPQARKVTKLQPETIEETMRRFMAPSASFDCALL